MILLTDARMRPEWDTVEVAKLLSAKKRGPLHVVQFDNGGDVFKRSDDSFLFPLAKKRGGVAMSVGDLAEYRRSKLKKKALYLLRPTRIENIKVNKEELDPLQEGSGTKAYFFEKKAPQKFHFYGELWSTPIKQSVSPNRSNSKALGAFVFSLDRFDKLTRKEQLKLAMWANVVSPVTSFLAVEPGVRPSLIGLNRSGSLGARRARSPSVRMGAAAAVTDLLRYLKPALDKCAPLRKSAQHLSVDLTSYEIVDVRPAPHRNKKATQCLVEAIWSIDLPKDVYWLRERSYDIQVPKG